MRYIVDHDFHIHSQLSLCSGDPEQTPERILQYAKDNGLKTICLTDHFWDGDVFTPPEWYDIQNLKWIKKALPLPQAEGIRFLFGCETEFDHNFTLGLAPHNYDEFDFIVVPTTHMHMRPFVISHEDYDNLERRTQVWAERVDRLLDLPLPFHKVGIAHLTCKLIAGADHEQYLTMLDSIPESTLEYLFTKAAAKGVGIELNRDDMVFADEEADTVLRPYRVAKRCGCKFFLGSDVHRAETFAIVKDIFERAIDLLDLKESDKFILK